MISSFHGYEFPDGDRQHLNQVERSEPTCEPTDWILQTHDQLWSNAKVSDGSQPLGASASRLGVPAGDRVLDHLVRVPDSRAIGNTLERCSPIASHPGMAREIRAHLFALTHNLLVLLRRNLDASEGIREKPIVKKLQEALFKREAKALESGRKVSGIHRLLPAVVQLTAQFFRTCEMEWPSGCAG